MTVKMSLLLLSYVLLRTILVLWFSTCMYCSIWDFLEHFKDILGESAIMEECIFFLCSKLPGTCSIFYCCSSFTQSCLTLCDPMDCSTPDFPVLHYLLEFSQTHVHRVDDAIQLSHPLSPPSPLALNLCQHHVAKVLELQHQSFQ